MEVLQEIGSYAGFAAVFGLAILSALYFSQARDVKRLREWAGRAPERAAEIDAGGRDVAAVPVAARPQPVVKPPQPAAAPAAAGATAATAAAGAAAATAAGPAENGNEESQADDEVVEGEEVVAAEADGDAADGDEKSAGADEDAEEQPSAAPAAATAAGAVASGAGTAERPATAVAGQAAATTSAPTGDTGTGAKVLPARRPVPPVRPRPTIPPRPVPPRPGQTSVLGKAPGSRPPARRGGREWPAPRYIALIVAGIVILGLGGTVGVLQLTKEDTPEEPATREPETNVGDPTAEPDRPEPARVNPADVTVTVLNATSTTGLAVRILSQLETAGFQKGNTGNATERQRAESVVMYKPGKKEDARAVARKLDIGSTQPIDEQGLQLAGAASVVVVLGADKANQ